MQERAPLPSQGRGHLNAVGNIILRRRQSATSDEAFVRTSPQTAAPKKCIALPRPYQSR
jgi:hypothetical protein